MTPGPRALTAAIVAAAVLLVSGCASVQVPYAPAPLFVPSSTTVADGPAPKHYDLNGVLDAGDGLTAGVHTELQLGNVDTAPDILERRRDWQTVRLDVTGAVTVTNTADRPNRAVGTVFYRVWAAYPRSSTLCARASGRDGQASTTPGLCWLDVGGATTYSYDPDHHGPPHALAGHRSKTVTFGTRESYAGIWLSVPLSEVDTVAAELREPVVVVTTAHSIDLGWPYRFAGSCSSDLKSPDVNDRLTVVGASEPLTCGQLPRS